MDFHRECLGCGELNEQFVERFHQCGKRDQLRARNMRKLVTKCTAVCRWEEQRNHEQVVAAKEKMNQLKKRKFKKESKAEKNKKRKYESRKEKLNAALSNMENMEEVKSAEEAIRETLVEK